MPQLFSNLTAFFSPLLPPSIKGSWLREGGRVITEVQVQEHSYRLIDIYFGYFGTNGKHDELVTRLENLGFEIHDYTYISDCLSQRELLDGVPYYFSTLAFACESTSALIFQPFSLAKKTYTSSKLSIVTLPPPSSSLSSASKAPSPDQISLQDDQQERFSSENSTRFTLGTPDEFGFQDISSSWGAANDITEEVVAATSSPLQVSDNVLSPEDLDCFSFRSTSQSSFARKRGFEDEQSDSFQTPFPEKRARTAPPTSITSPPSPISVCSYFVCPVATVKSEEEEDLEVANLLMLPPCVRAKENLTSHPSSATFSVLPDTPFYTNPSFAPNDTSASDQVLTIEISTFFLAYQERLQAEQEFGFKRNIVGGPRRIQQASGAFEMSGLGLRELIKGQNGFEARRKTIKDRK